MAKKKKFVMWRRLERPYTRYSKFRSKSFVRNKPNSRVVRYDMGVDKDWPTVVKLVSKKDVQIRDLAIESARLSANRILEKKVGKGNYKFKIRIHPHHILRENPLAAGAGADRMSTGMAHSFGKIVGIAARVHKNQVLFQVGVDNQHLQTARDALKQSQHKLPCSCSIVVEQAKPAKVVEKEEAKPAEASA